jgi:hypothetical protein
MSEKQCTSIDASSSCTITGFAVSIHNKNTERDVVNIKNKIQSRTCLITTCSAESIAIQSADSLFFLLHVTKQK